MLPEHRWDLGVWLWRVPWGFPGSFLLQESVRCLGISDLILDPQLPPACPQRTYGSPWAAGLGAGPEQGTRFLSIHLFILSCCSGSLEDAVASCGPHLASGAGEGKGEGAALGCRDHDGCLKPRTRGLTDALPDSSASARSHEKCSKRDKLSQGRPSETPQGATQQGVPGSPTVSPLSIANKDPQAEEFGQGAGHPQARNRSGVRPPSTRGPAASGDDAGGYTPPSACASALGRSRKQESRASTLYSASSSVPSQGAQRACPRQHHSPKDIHCPVDSSVSRPMPGLSSRGRAHPHGPPPRRGS